jgi:ADP-ribose pyrophosphatase YjhB (NUDIX family)
MSQTPFRFCPYCATPLALRTVYGRARWACPACPFVQFPDPKVAVIALVTQGEQVLLVQRAMEPAKGKWSLPGGYMDAGEMPEEALRRELLEEVDLAVQIQQLLEIFPMVVTSGRSNGIVLAYHAIPASTGEMVLRCQDDACDAGWFLSDQFPEELAFASTATLLSQWRQGWRPPNHFLENASSERI